MQSTRAIRLMARHFIRRQYHGIQGHNTMNQLPIPEGDFFAHHAKTNAKYNAIFAVGIASSIFSVFLARTTGLIVLHYDPPATYES